MAAPKRAHAHVNLNEPAFAAFREAAATAYPGHPLTSAVREAVLVFMGTDPLEASKSAARRAAWLMARNEIAKILGAAMREAAQHFSEVQQSTAQELSDMEAQGLISHDPKKAA